MIFGVGYALSKIRGKTSRNMTAAVPLDIGLSGTMIFGNQTIQAPFPGIGIGLGALDALVLGAQDVVKSKLIKILTNTLAFPFDVTGLGDGYGTLLNLKYCSFKCTFFRINGSLQQEEVQTIL